MFLENCYNFYGNIFKDQRSHHFGTIDTFDIFFKISL